MMRYILAIPALLVMTACLLPPVALAAGDLRYLELDREARGVQADFAAAGGSLPPTPLSVLLSLNPSAPPDVDALPARLQGMAGDAAASMPAGRDGAGLWLAKDWMNRGYVGQAADLLAGMNPADGGVAAERTVLLAEILAGQGRAAEAASLLEGVQSPRLWSAYARYNRAVVLQEAGREELAASALEALAVLESADAEALALRDRANIALGFFHLRRGENAAAKAAFERVRFDSPFSARALFGLGWVEFGQGNASRALIPWVELSQRRQIEPAVQEVLLLVPYVHWHLDAHRESVQQYRSAIAVLDGELERLDRMIAGARDGAMLDALVVTTDQEGLPLFELPDGHHAARPGFLGQARFQVAHATYRHLRDLEQRLSGMPGAATARQRLAGALDGHRAYLRDYVVAELARDRERTAAYQARAHFELARLLDEVAARGEGR